MRKSVLNLIMVRLENLKALCGNALAKRNGVDVEMRIVISFVMKLIQ